MENIFTNKQARHCGRQLSHPTCNKASSCPTCQSRSQRSLFCLEIFTNLWSKKKLHICKNNNNNCCTVLLLHFADQTCRPGRNRHRVRISVPTNRWDALPKSSPIPCMRSAFGCKIKIAIANADSRVPSLSPFHR